MQGDLLLRHILAGLPPGHAGDGAGVGQVDEGEVNGRTLLVGQVLGHHCRAPARGGVPHLEQAVILDKSTFAFNGGYLAMLDCNLHLLYSLCPIVVYIVHF